MDKFPIVLGKFLNSLGFDREFLRSFCWFSSRGDRVTLSFNTPLTHLFGSLATPVGLEAVGQWVVKEHLYHLYMTELTGKVEGSLTALKYKRYVHHMLRDTSDEKVGKFLPLFILEASRMEITLRNKKNLASDPHIDVTI